MIAIKHCHWPLHANYIHLDYNIRIIITTYAQWTYTRPDDIYTQNAWWLRACSHYFVIDMYTHLYICDMHMNIQEISDMSLCTRIYKYLRCCYRGVDAKTPEYFCDAFFDHDFCFFAVCACCRFLNIALYHYTRFVTQIQCYLYIFFSIYIYSFLYCSLWTISLYTKHLIS